MLELLDYIILSLIYLMFVAVLIFFYKQDQEIKFTKLQTEVKTSMTEFKSYGNSLRASLGRLAGNIPSGGDAQEMSMPQMILAMLMNNPKVQDMISNAIGGAMSNVSVGEGEKPSEGEAPEDLNISTQDSPHT